MEKYNILMLRFLEQTLFLVDTFFPESVEGKKGEQKEDSAIVKELTTNTITQFNKYQLFG